MSRLFIVLYLDEDVDVLIADLVRARGFSAQTTVEAGMLGASDEDQLDYASRHQMAFLTHNRVDFENLINDYYSSGRSHSGVIIAVRRSPYEITKRSLNDC